MSLIQFIKTAKFREISLGFVQIHSSAKQQRSVSLATLVYKLTCLLIRESITWFFILITFQIKLIMHYDSALKKHNYRFVLQYQNYFMSQSDIHASFTVPRNSTYPFRKQP